MTLEELKALEIDLQGHRDIKRKNPNYPSLPKSVRAGREIFMMNEEQYAHLCSCLRGFNSRLHNYNEALRRRMLNQI
jgi:hypothetical protein